jgi:hypothetical protein
MVLSCQAHRAPFALPRATTATLADAHQRALERTGFVAILGVTIVGCVKRGAPRVTFLLDVLFSARAFRAMSSWQSQAIYRGQRRCW